MDKEQSADGWGQAGEVKERMVAHLVKNPPTIQETWFDPWVRKILLEDGIATHSSILAWRIPWTVWSMRSQTVGRDWVTFTLPYTLWSQTEEVSQERRNGKLHDLLFVDQVQWELRIHYCIWQKAVHSWPWQVISVECWRQKPDSVMEHHQICVRCIVRPKNTKTVEFGTGKGLSEGHGRRWFWALGTPKLLKGFSKAPLKAKRWGRDVVSCCRLPSVRSFVFEVRSWSGNNVPVNL